MKIISIAKARSGGYVVFIDGPDKYTQEVISLDNTKEVIGVYPKDEYGDYTRFWNIMSKFSSAKFLRDPIDVDILTVEALDNIGMVSKGGKGSGNFGHAGRPGQVGGSGSGGAAHAIIDLGAQWDKAKAKLKSQDISFTYIDRNGNEDKFGEYEDYGRMRRCITMMNEIDTYPSIVKDKIKKIEVYDEGYNLGTFEAGGKTFKRGGDWDKSQMKVRIGLSGDYLSLFHHEMGHVEFDTMQELAIKGYRQVVTKANAKADAVAKHERANGLLKDPDTIEKKAYNAFERMHVTDSTSGSYMVFPTDYAKAWSKEAVVDKGHDFGLRRSDGSTFVVNIAYKHRAENESYAEISTWFKTSQDYHESAGVTRQEFMKWRGLHREWQYILKKASEEKKV